MRFVHSALLLAVSACPAFAQRGPVIVIPGRPDNPIFENGADVSWSVLEGEFGLDRPGQVTPTVIYRAPPVIVPYYGAGAYMPHYFPMSGQQPGYGRLEVVPNRPVPQQAPKLSPKLVGHFRADAGGSAVAVSPHSHRPDHFASDWGRGPWGPNHRPWGPPGAPGGPGGPGRPGGPGGLGGFGGGRPPGR
jgi:hypothetical protein